MFRSFALVVLLALSACAGVSDEHSVGWDNLKYTDYAALGGGFLPMGK